MLTVRMRVGFQCIHSYPPSMTCETCYFFLFLGLNQPEINHQKLSSTAMPWLILTDMGSTWNNYRLPVHVRHHKEIATMLTDTVEAKGKRSLRPVLNIDCLLMQYKFHSYKWTWSKESVAVFGSCSGGGDSKELWITRRGKQTFCEVQISLSQDFDLAQLFFRYNYQVGAPLCSLFHSYRCVFRPCFNFIDIFSVKVA